MLRVKDLAVTFATAVATAAVAVVVVGPVGAGAGRHDDVVVSVRGVTLALETVQATRTPVARIAATNTTGAPRRIDGRLRLIAERASSPGSRMASEPYEAWSTPLLLVLAPGESRTVELTSAKTLPLRGTARFELNVGRKVTRTASFVPLRAAEAEVALAAVRPQDVSAPAPAAPSDQAQVEVRAEAEAAAPAAANQDPGDGVQAAVRDNAVDQEAVEDGRQHEAQTTAARRARRQASAPLVAQAASQPAAPRHLARPASSKPGKPRVAMAGPVERPRSTQARPTPKQNRQAVRETARPAKTAPKIEKARR